MKRAMNLILCLLAIATLATFFFFVSVTGGIMILATLAFAGRAHGILMDWEDQQTGGFLNPEPIKDEKKKANFLLSFR
jgi:hypothetical protein